MSRIYVDTLHLGNIAQALAEALCVNKTLTILSLHGRRRELSAKLWEDVAVGGNRTRNSEIFKA
jgi:hypothetical protein